MRDDAVLPGRYERQMYRPLDGRAWGDVHHGAIADEGGVERREAVIGDGRERSEPPLRDRTA